MSDAVAGGVNSNVRTRHDRPIHRFLVLFCRAMGFAMLYELLAGKYSKLNAEWFGAGGDKITELSEGALEHGTWGWTESLIQNVIIPNAAVLSYSVVIIQLLLGVSLLSGAFVRLMALISIPMFVGMNVFVQTIRTPHWYLSAMIAIVVLYPLLSFGADRRWLARTEHDERRHVRIRRSVITLSFLRKLGSPLPLAIAAGGLLAFTSITVVEVIRQEDQKLQLTALEGTFYGLALLIGLGLWRFRGMSGWALAIPMMRIKLGMALLWPILANRTVKITALPGFGGEAATSDLLQGTIAVSHWEPLARFAEGVLAPNVGAFVTVTGVVQLTLGVALLLGLQLRRTLELSVVYLAVVMLIGYTRTTQYALLFSVAVLMLGGGWSLSLDRLLRRAEPVLDLPRSLKTSLRGLGVFAVFGVLFLGVTTNPYASDVSGAVFIAMTLSLVPLTGPAESWLAERSVSLSRVLQPSRLDVALRSLMQDAGASGTGVGPSWVDAAGKSRALGPQPSSTLRPLGKQGLSAPPGPLRWDRPRGHRPTERNQTTAST